MAVPFDMGVCELWEGEDLSVHDIRLRAKVATCAACGEKRGVSLPSKTTGAPVKSTINHKRTRKNDNRPKFEVASDFHLRIRKARRRLNLGPRLGRD